MFPKNIPQLIVALAIVLCTSCSTQIDYTGAEQTGWHAVVDAELDRLLNSVHNENSQTLELTLKTTVVVSSIRQSSAVKNVVYAMSGDYAKIKGVDSISREYDSQRPIGGATITQDCAIEVRRVDESDTGEYRLWRGEAIQVGWTTEREYLIARLGEIHVEAVEDSLL